MDVLDFDYEFYSKVQDPGDVLRDEAEERLLTLAEGNDDLIGASVVVEELANEATSHTFEARIVAYVRPENVAATEQSDTARGALRGALKAIERQVREQRDRLRKPWK